MTTFRGGAMTRTWWPGGPRAVDREDPVGKASRTERAMDCQIPGLPAPACRGFRVKLSPPVRNNS